VSYCHDCGCAPCRCWEDFVETCEVCELATSGVPPHKVNAVKWCECGDGSSGREDAGLELSLFGDC